ncbi:MAG: transcription-repair coupling factor, partial [Limisphaerales bacterium]
MAQNESSSATGKWFADIAKTSAAQSLAQRLKRGGAFSFSGIALSAQPFFAALISKFFPQRTIVVVVENLKTQESFQQDLETWLAQIRNAERGVRNENAAPSSILNSPSSLFFPAWETSPHENKLPHADVISDRLQTLVALSEKSAIGNRQSAIIVTNVVALLQKTFSPDDLKTRTRKLERGDKIAPLDLIEFLEEQGYEPEAQVSQKGEIALRGGIVDIFPPTSPWPIRLEFFGDELESLREFDPLTQISRGEISEIIIPPAGEIGILKNCVEQASS